MDAIDRGAKGLLAAIRKSDEYQEYKRQEAVMLRDPQLFQRVNMFRANNYRFQNETNHDLFYAADQVEKESVELRRIPEANAFLQAELALCKLIQNVYKEIADGIDMHVPYL